MQIQREAVGDVTILVITGEFDVQNLSGAETAVAELIAAGVRRLIANLNGVTFITSSALGFLVRTHRELTRLGGEMAIAAPSAYLHRTMTTLGVDRVFPVFDTDEEAIRHFGGG